MCPLERVWGGELFPFARLLGKTPSKVYWSSISKVTVIDNGVELVCVYIVQIRLGKTLLSTNNCNTEKQGISNII